MTKLSCRTQDLDATFLASLHHFFRDNMLKTRQFLTVATALALVTGASARLLAQGVTTGAVSGTVTDPTGAPIEGAQVQVRNSRTGASAGGITRSNGQFNVQGVEPDAGYSITVRRIEDERARRASGRARVTRSACRKPALKAR